MDPKMIKKSIIPADTLPQKDTLAYASESVGYGMLPRKTISTNINKITTNTAKINDLYREFHLDNVDVEVYKIFHKQYFERAKKEVVK